MRVVERPFSEFLRQPNEVVADLADHDVVLRRRNAPALRLSEAERDEERDEAFDALARLLRNLLVHRPVGLETTIDNFAPVGQLLREWKATAEVHADPRVARRLRRRVEASGEAVPVPSG